MDDGVLAIGAAWRGGRGNRVQIADIEAGRNIGSAPTVRKLADALGVTVDDLVCKASVINRMATPA